MNIHIDNPFAGTWSAGNVSVVIDKIAWTAKYCDSVYNSGTYSFEENIAKLKVTNRGIGRADVGENGFALISNNKMVVSGLIDTNMNGSYTKSK